MRPIDVKYRTHPRAVFTSPRTSMPGTSDGATAIAASPVTSDTAATVAKANTSWTTGFSIPRTPTAILLVTIMTASSTADIAPRRSPPASAEPLTPSIPTATIPRNTTAKPRTLRAVRRSPNSSGERAITMTGPQ